MKKLLIKVFCGITVCTLFMFVGCNGNSTSEETSQEMSTASTTTKATAKAIPDKDILLSAPPFPELSTDEAKREVSKTESSVVESSIEESSEVESSIEESSEEVESLVEDTEESYETEDETSEVEYYYEEEDYEEYATEDNYDETYDDEYIVEDTVFQSDYDALYTPADFQNMGIINWGGWCWTFYSQQAMPGEGLIIPGRHVDYNGYVCDENDYICLASSSLDKGTVVDTPFGKMGKVYDCGCLSYILDVYVDW